jgi:glycosyltransferase involved in cell wall biosynthesis
MAAGTPVISTRVGAIPDVMEHGIHGLFVPLRDVEETAAAIETLYTDIDLWGRMSQACEQRIREHYTVERLAKDFVALYRSLERRDPLPGGIL